MKKMIVPATYAGVKQPFSRCVRVGNFVFPAGAAARLIETSHVDPGKKNDAVAQVKDCMDKLKSALEGGQSSLEHVVKTTIYLKDIVKDAEGVVKAYEDYIRKNAPALLEAMPSLTVIGVTGLFQPEQLVEIDVFAVVPDKI